MPITISTKKFLVATVNKFSLVQPIKNGILAENRLPTVIKVGENTWQVWSTAKEYN